MNSIRIGDMVRLGHEPKWFGAVAQINADAAVVESIPGSQIPDVGGWPLPIDLLEDMPDWR